jgi:hypothetical protein
MPRLNRVDITINLIKDNMANLKQTNAGKQLIHEILATDKSKLIHFANSKKDSAELKKNLHTPKSKPPVK